MHKKTKIVCTLGPASENIHTLEKMVKKGMDVARLNFSHGSYESFARIIKMIRTLERKLDQPIAIIQDLQGPKIRIGTMPAEGILVKKGQKIILTTATVQGDTARIPVQYRDLPRDLKKNDQILIDDGLIELKVLSIKKNEIFCQTVVGGIIKNHKGINVPTASISANPLTEKDRQDLLFGLEHDVDYVALSFVKSAKNIQELRELIREKRGRAKIIAKIERHEAVENMESIIDEADGVMVARGDLGVEIPAEQVPLVQKRMIHRANLHGKPVITATQILQSMVENPRATRAEISDAANAVFDYSDAVMLSNESAVGKYPVEATETLAKVSASVEAELSKNKDLLPNRLFKKTLPTAYATCVNAAELALDIDAKLLVAMTISGFTAEHIAKHRIFIPMIAITEDPKVQHQLVLVWGIQKTFLHSLKIAENPVQIRQFLLKQKLVKKGDRVVVVSNASKEEKTIMAIKI